RGTSISRMTTCSMRPPWRRTTWAAAHSDFAGQPNQTTGRLPWDLLVSSPARRMLFRFRASVASRRRIGESLQSRGGGGGAPSAGVSDAGLQLAGLVQGQQRLAVLAVAPLQVALALAGHGAAVGQVDVVDGAVGVEHLLDFVGVA